MDVLKAIRILKEKEVLVETAYGKNIYYGYDKIRSHSHKYESTVHFIVKALTGKLILKKGDGMITEHEYPDGKIVDVLQIKRNGDLIGYQIETNGFKEKDFKNTDVIYVSLKKYPEINGYIKRLENILKEFIV